MIFTGYFINISNSIWGIFDIYVSPTQIFVIFTFHQLNMGNLLLDHGTGGVPISIRHLFLARPNAEDVPKPMPFVVSWDCLAKDNLRELQIPKTGEHFTRPCLKGKRCFLVAKAAGRLLWGSNYRWFPRQIMSTSRLKKWFLSILPMERWLVKDLPPGKAI